MKQNGFISLTTLVAIIFAIAIIGLAGWRVYSYTDNQPQGTDIKNDSGQSSQSDNLESTDGAPSTSDTQPNPSFIGSPVTPPADAPTSSDDDDEYEDETEDEYEPSESRPEDEIED